jgi:hypothetical protein
LPQSSRNAFRHPVDPDCPRSAEIGSHIFRYVDDRLAGTVSRKADDRLTSSNHLSWLGQHRRNNAVCVGTEHGVAGGITRYVGLGSGGSMIAACGIECGFGSVVTLPRYKAGLSDRTKPALLPLREIEPRGGGIYETLLRCRAEREIRSIDPHQWRAAMDGLACIHQTAGDLPIDPKTQVAFDPGGDHTCQATSSGVGRPGQCGLNQWRLSARVNVRCAAAA